MLIYHLPKRKLHTHVYCMAYGIYHTLRTRILRIVKVLKIHEFLQILKLSVLKFNLSHSSPPFF